MSQNGLRKIKSVVCIYFPENVMCCDRAVILVVVEISCRGCGSRYVTHSMTVNCLYGFKVLLILLRAVL